MTPWEVKRCNFCSEDVPESSLSKNLSDQPVRKLRTSRKRRARTRFIDYLSSRGESPPKHSEESNTEEKAPTFVYRKMLETDFSSLATGDGLSMLHQLGLDGFAKQPVPPFRMSACDEFISSFREQTSSGTVQGRDVSLSPLYVALATRLPFKAKEGDKSRFFSHSIAAREHNMGHLVYGEDNKLVKEIGALVAVKLWCKDQGYRRAKQDVLLAHLYMLMVKSITKVADKANHGSVVFPYGEWLSKIIEDQLHGVTVRVTSAHGSTAEMKLNREDARQAVKKVNSSTDLDVEVVVRPKGSVVERAGSKTEILQLKKRVRQLEERHKRGKELVSKLLDVSGLSMLEADS